MDGSEQPVAASSKLRKRRGQGKPFVKGDARINRRGVPREAVALAKKLRDLAADVLFSPSPRCEDKTRLIAILEALADKAERGDVRAAELLLERVGGKPTPPEENVSERGRIVIEWDGPPPPWAPKEDLDDYARQQSKKYGDPPALPASSPAPAIDVTASKQCETVAAQLTKRDRTNGIGSDDRTFFT